MCSCRIVLWFIYCVLILPYSAINCCAFLPHVFQDCIWCESYWWFMVSRRIWYCQRKHIKLMGKAWWVSNAFGNDICWLNRLFILHVFLFSHFQWCGLQWWSSNPLIWIGGQNKRIVLWCSSCHHIPYPH